MDEFINLFGHITVSNIIYFILACGFVYKVYTTIRDFFANKAEDDIRHKQKVLDMIDAVKELTKDKTKMLETQKAMQTQLVQLYSAQQANSERLTQLETNINNRERNKFTAFWSLFDDYEAIGGNGYVHSVVQPAMQSLEVIEMDDVDNISHLTASRK